MRPSLQASPTLTALVTGTTALAVLLIGVTAAVAGPADTTDAPTAHGRTADQDGTESHDLSATPPRCEDHLVTFTRERTDGDDRAVAITAQALERGVDGWQLLTWEADPTTTLTLVLATAADGNFRTLLPTATGTIEHVQALTFCGDRDPAPAVDTGAEPSGAAGAEPLATRTRTQPRPSSGLDERPMDDDDTRHGTDDDTRHGTPEQPRSVGSEPPYDGATMQPSPAVSDHASSVEPVTRSGPEAEATLSDAAEDRRIPAPIQRTLAPPASVWPARTTMDLARVSANSASTDGGSERPSTVASTGLTGGGNLALLTALLVLLASAAAIPLVRRTTGPPATTVTLEPDDHPEDAR